MTIAILPARLANQIAAGEVVERPASVIKELIENSLDAGATKIQIDIDKGGIKKIKITDNGHGIVKDQLTLALSRHATSKIKDLNDLEAINSLGFRGEALASISSVSRLTLTSKPKEQSTAWQAIAEGRDMAVNVKPAAHPDGTSIEVLDLFFNTPARRKFLRTEKTEFNHIDEVVRRIALAHFDVAFILTHNGNIVRQYRMANTQAQFTKRVAMVCGQKFIDHAVELDCPHDSMTLSGWLAKPSFSRSQNDLCYSYVNGRMMRDKLINHAIRQAYADLLPADTYPAFVLFLQLDHKEVDVNVHPAKHEVRFHQSRYVHDFIYSVCHKALLSALAGEDILDGADTAISFSPEQVASSVSEHSAGENGAANYQRADYIKPLQHVNEARLHGGNYAAMGQKQSSGELNIAAKNYQTLMATPITNPDRALQSSYDNETVTSNTNELTKLSPVNEDSLISIHEPGFALYKAKDGMRVLSLFKLAKAASIKLVQQSWQSQGDLESAQLEGLVSQPLLLPIMINLSKEQVTLALAEQALFSKAGVEFTAKSSDKIQVRQFPALLREQNVSNAFIRILEELCLLKSTTTDDQLTENHFFNGIAAAMVSANYDRSQAENLMNLAKNLFNEQLSQQLLLNSIPLDLTSHTKQLL
jgi:DNA mismatch repair protein MutL